MEKNIKIRNFINFDSVAYYLNVSSNELRKLLISRHKTNYEIFTISKRNGSKRTIYKPSKELFDIQEKIKDLLDSEFTASKYSFAYKKGVNVIDNARPHVNKDYVIHLDIEDFFRSINFGRIISMFSKYFHANNQVAGTLANICCIYTEDEVFLPQGACTSPIISNIIAKTLDNQILTLLKSFRLRDWNYTRYADDITISTNSNYFEKIDLIEQVQNIIEENGFVVNNKKTRVETKNIRQSVTGIVVNDKLNVSRKYRKSIKAYLYGFKRANEQGTPLEVMYATFWKSYRHRNSKYDKATPFDVLRGMIYFVGNVRGLRDKEFIDFAKKFNELVGKLEVDTAKIKYVDSVLYDKVTTNTFLVDDFITETNNFGLKFMNTEGKLEYAAGYGQGSGVLLEGGYFLTNYHVLSDIFDVFEKGQKIYYRNFKQNEYVKANNIMDVHILLTNPVTNERTYGNIVTYDKMHDWVVLDILGSPDARGFQANTNQLYPNMKTTVAGYPEYTKGDTLFRHTGRLGNKHGNTWELSGINIYGGNSGGPVLNKNNELIGIVSKGTTETGSVIPQMISLEKIKIPLRES